MARHSSIATAVGILWLSAVALGQSNTNDQADPQYPTSQRIQISESCPLIAKWLTQMLSSGAHWQLLQYDPDLGILAFKVSSMDKLTKADVRQYLVEDSKKTENVHADGVVFTLRSLVASTLSFNGAQQPSGHSCAIAVAFKFIGKDGTALASSGRMETELLQRVTKRYTEHGLDY